MATRILRKVTPEEKPKTTPQQEPSEIRLRSDQWDSLKHLLWALAEIAELALVSEEENYSSTLKVLSSKGLDLISEIDDQAGGGAA